MKRLSWLLLWWPLAALAAYVEREPAPAEARSYTLTDQVPAGGERCYAMTVTGWCAGELGESGYSNQRCYSAAPVELRWQQEMQCADGGALASIDHFDIYEWVDAPGQTPAPPVLGLSVIGELQLPSSPAPGGEMTTLVLTNNTVVQNATADDVVADAIDWTMLDSLNPDTVYTSGTMHVRRASNARSRSIIMLPDFLPEIPAGQTIISATWYLSHNDANWSGGDVAIRRMLTDYTIGQATWNVRATSTAWASTGSQGDDTDRVAAASDVNTVPDAAAGYYAYDVTADLAAMYAGSVNARGWILECDAGGVLLGTVMPDGLNSSLPELVIVYEADGGEAADVSGAGDAEAAFVPTVSAGAALAVSANAQSSYSTIETVLRDLVEERQGMAQVLNSLAEAMQAMSDQLDALAGAMLGEDDGALHSLDGDLEGGERDPLDVL